LVKRLKILQKSITRRNYEPMNYTRLWIPNGAAVNLDDRHKTLTYITVETYNRKPVGVLTVFFSILERCKVEGNLKDGRHICAKERRMAYLHMASGRSALGLTIIIIQVKL
jgi:hypothetical protein